MDAKDKEQMIIDYLGLVGKIAGKYASDMNPYDDLFQVGCIGLMKAVDDFDESRGFKFTTFAWKVIQNQIFKYLRKQKKHEKAYSLNNIVDVEEGIEFMDLLQDDSDLEFDAVEEVTFQEYRNSVEAIEFTDYQKQIMSYRRRGLSQNEIAQRVGFSQSIVSRHLKICKNKVLKELNRRGELCLN